MRRSVASSQTSTAGKEFAADVEYYLTQRPRQLPSRYFYDPLGSALFDAICELPWYAITRAELSLLDSHARDVFSHLDPLSRIVELGPGNGDKLSHLVASGSAGAARSRALDLHLVDVSAAALDDAGRALAALGDLGIRVNVVTHQATYEAGLIEVGREGRRAGRTLALFLGSNIGNFDRPDAEAFLRGIRAALMPGDALLIGADLVKPERDLLLAYDDPLGVTAAFNRNLLVRINRELGGTFDVDAFAHQAVWNAEESRVEMHLVSRRRQDVRVEAANVEFVLDEGERIWTESSYKYEAGELAAMLEQARFRVVDQWVDGEARFALTLVSVV